MTKVLYIKSSIATTDDLMSHLIGALQEAFQVHTLYLPPVTLENANDYIKSMRSLPRMNFDATISEGLLSLGFQSPLAMMVLKGKADLKILGSLSSDRGMQAGIDVLPLSTGDLVLGLLGDKAMFYKLFWPRVNVLLKE